ncbi:MAG: hypothetical protein EP315_08485, partial [Gammaproteobacteria bacterium]
MLLFNDLCQINAVNMLRKLSIRLAISFLFVSVINLQGCGGGGSSCSLGTGPNVSVSGRVTFDRVHHHTNGALDYNNITQEPGRGLVVEAICNSTIATTSTDSNGNYALSVPANTSGLMVRVKAQMKQTGSPSWDFSVVDNSRSQALYVMDSSRQSIGGTGLVINLHADSGWTGSSFALTRVAAPFAILDTVYKAMQLILTQDAN